MGKKILQILRKVNEVIHWLLFGCCIGIVMLGKNNIIITIALFFYGIEIFFDIKDAIRKKNKYRNMYKKYQEMFENLKYIHKERYGLYFSEDIEEVEYVTKCFNECAAEQIVVGNMLLENPNISLKEKAEIQQIMDKTNELLKNIQPPM